MTAEATPTPPQVHPLSRPRIEKVTMTLACVLCIAGTLWLSNWLRTPGTPGAAGTILLEPNWPVALGAAWISIIGGAVVAAAIASRVNYDAGLFCACVGAIALALRYGTMRAALHNASNPSVFALMAVETLALFAAVAVAWGILRSGMSAKLLPAEVIYFEEEPDEPLDQKLIAAAAHGVLMVLGMMLFSQSDAKMQSLAAVGLASYLATLGAHQMVPIRPSFWFLLAPAAVGLIGYLTQWMRPGLWNIGDVGGFFAPLCRPIPLDYATVGPAGALLAYWTSHHWRHESIEDELD
jgi:hypothetical protein